MPRFIKGEDGRLFLHDSDCSCCGGEWSGTEDSEGETLEEMVANFARMSTDTFQNLSPKETHIVLYKRCQEQAGKIQDKEERKKMLRENRENFDAVMAELEKKEAEEAEETEETEGEKYKANEVEVVEEEELWD